MAIAAAAQAGESAGSADRTRRRVTVLAGGPSDERQVSLWSGQAVAEALRSRGHDVHLLDAGPGDLSALDEPADVIFPVLHGTWGEDGTLQQLLEVRGRRFVGSGSAASALAMDKVRAKQVVAGLGLRTAAFEVITAADAAAGRVATIAAPLVVKPVDQGSSVLTFIVADAAGVEPAVRRVVERFGRALVEKFVRGEELTVGVVGGQVLPPICVRPKAGFYDYEAKYLSDDTEYDFEPGLPAAVLDLARSASLRVFEALGCRHLARIDWIVDETGELWFLEANTLPGFTSHSLVPKAAARAGIEFGALCERLVEMAMAEERRA